MSEPKNQTQLDKFKEAARELETDDDPELFKERLRKIVKHKPVEDAEAVKDGDLGTRVSGRGLRNP